ncbi:hypothetical protein ID866_1773 [Astraeus odoratus]|nr:hypothetical protein ID866_1773 [Astraeus odoratus]
MALEEKCNSSPSIPVDLTPSDVVTTTLASNSHAHTIQDPANDSPNHRHVPVGPSISFPTAKTPRGTPRFSLPDTPSARTGPPRSLSYHFTPSYPPTISQQVQYPDASESADIYDNDSYEFPFRSDPDRFTSFRGALEHHNLSSEKEVHDRKGKNKESSRTVDESWNPMRWFHDSAVDEKTEQREKLTASPEPHRHDEPHQEEILRCRTTTESKEDPSSNALRRSQTHPHESKHSGSTARWAKLRSLLPSIVRHPSTAPAHSVVASEVNITDELIAGGLCAVMLKLWFEHDDKGHRRIPVLLHRLRLRISDSLHPLHEHKAVFRIECEYANGAIRWVIYRQLRDFVSLHTHYTISNAFSGSKDVLPEFPRTSLPYFKFLRRESGEGQVSQSNFARLQREALEDYLINLIHAVMFHPSANRLAGFLEISALFIALAPFGGLQYKAGFLRTESAGNGAGIGRRSTGRSARKELRWCAVRESYLVIVEDPGETTVWDVFLLDSDFRIIQPIRYYRKGLHLLRPEAADREFRGTSRTEGNPRVAEREVDCLSVVDAFRTKLSRIFCFGHRSTPNINIEHMERPSSSRPSHRRQDTASSGSSVPSEHVQSPPLIVDPSTNRDPLGVDGDDREQDPTTQLETERRKRKKRPQDVSKHTFYIQNSQMKLKLSARNERQMLQWITALEKAYSSSPWVAKHRFDSFAPVRMNVATQWLVDGRDYMWNLSRALMMARETVYIHDWWLSPELQLRRPNRSKYRLDRLLERKAKEGVKIFIILYQEVSSKTTPTDSNYAKQKLASLHENIMVQRSPSHFQTGTFYWAHHEKLCVIDQTIAFMGGIDLCFGRWDTPQHVLVDDAELNPNKTEIWPGKDYSNPRVVDFHTLNRPEEDMYDRAKVPRMPWHDVGMQVVGQPARDLGRHFVERWNYLLRIKARTRPNDYISIFSLRNWGKLRNDILTTEIVYIHAKVCVVDDRLAIIGSANINERSQRGDRDSEVAAIIRDTDMIDGTMAGRPFKVGRFAHSLRVRLMQEHIGVDVDSLSEVDHTPRQPSKAEHEHGVWDPSAQQQDGGPSVTEIRHETPMRNMLADVVEEIKQVAPATRSPAARTLHMPLPDIQKHIPDAWKSRDASQERGTCTPDEEEEPSVSVIVPTLEERAIAENHPPSSQTMSRIQKEPEEYLGGKTLDDASTAPSVVGQACGPPSNASKSPPTDDEPRGRPDIEGTNLGKNVQRGRSTLRRRRTGKRDNRTWILPTPTPHVDPHGFEDPICDEFWKNVWVACAAHNTEIYRKVFHAVPDDTITTWKQYTEFVAYHERFMKPPKDTCSPGPASRAPPGTTENLPCSSHANGPDLDKSKETFQGEEGDGDSVRALPTNSQNLEKEPRRARSTHNQTEPFNRRDIEEMENLLKETRGHLVIYPTRFLVGEDEADNFLFNADKWVTTRSILEWANKARQVATPSNL